MSNKITLATVKAYFKDNGFEPRHDLNGLKHAANTLAKEENEDAEDLFLLVVSNQPIGNYTHSYGFHTATGRHLIETFQSHYHQYLN